MIYICQHYPYKNELSKARVTKMVYLADWKYALNHGEQITNIRWKYNHFGPYVFDIIDTAKESAQLIVENDLNLLGKEREIISVDENAQSEGLSDDEIKNLKFVINKTSKLNWQDFIKFVYGTYPIRSKPKYSTLDLSELAKKYSQIKHSKD